MPVTIKLFASFQQGRFEVQQRKLPPGTTLGSLLDQLEIPRQELGVLLVGGRHADVARVAQPGDVISIFPLLGGG